jgi:hypothetical protein
MTNFEEFKAKKLEDIGTRYEHYSDLLSIWEEALELMSSYSYIGKADESKQKILSETIEILRNTLDGMGEYHDLLIVLRRLVDWIPSDPTAITGGRGTPLKKGNDPYADIG